LVFSADEDYVAPAASHQWPIYENLDSDLKYYINLFDENHLGIVANSNLNSILFPFINFIVTNNDEYYSIFYEQLQELQSNNVLAFEYEYVAAEPAEVNAITSHSPLFAYPNPFNSAMTLYFDLTGSGKLEVLNIKGQVVRSFDEFPAGRHSVTWNGKNDMRQPVASGIYFWMLQTEERRWSIKIVLLK